MKLQSLFIGLLVALLSMRNLVAQAEDWGDLKGRFVFDGMAPERVALTINKDPEYCGKHTPKSEKLIVRPDDRGIANVVVWLDVKTGQKIPIHDSYAANAAMAVRLANKGCRFEPHVCVLRVGQTLQIDNPDTVDHNTAAGLDRNSPFNHLTAAGQSVKHSKFERSEKLPAQIQCSIHPWMLGWLVVKDHPYVAVSDEHGRFELKNIPAGEQTFVVWHEAVGFVQEVTRDGQSEVWKSGKVTRMISTRATDLGEVKLAPRLFAEP